ncbi:hypothetical protein PQC31_gp06 [Pseudomonas phage Iggy]|uniref:Uncharacterized protein n=1 Tax=Pseudomonas phage Iggy TaxID=2592193 RepID=A0A7S5ECV4_9CAUD|nr:hypothetical protein PQC31_gp06 [Pseudomonas phage Iggy]QEA09727.1 hypothetical protein [Pseudomonas phage Iggy]
MSLENRYFLFKIAELDRLRETSPEVAESLVRSLDKLAQIQGMCRAQRGADPDFKAIVIESDWPEYEEVLALLQKRVQSTEEDK